MSIRFSLLFFACLGCSVLSAKVIFVNPVSETGQDGHSWNTAFHTLQAALASAEPNDEIWVAQGSYISPQVGWKWKGDVAVLGSFQGFESNRHQRDFSLGSSELKMNPNGQRMISGNLFNQRFILDGFTLSASASELDGLIDLVHVSDATFSHCVFIGIQNSMRPLISFQSVSGDCLVQYCTFENINVKDVLISIQGAIQFRQTNFISIQALGGQIAACSSSQLSNCEITGNSNITLTHEQAKL